MKTLLRGLGVSVVSAALLYFVGINALLASPWGEQLMNQRPELVQIHFSRAWTLVPLQFEVRDFQLSMQDRGVQVMITADRVHGNLHPWTLLESRFVATGVKADGVTMAVRPRMVKGDPLEAHLAELPPIAGYETALLDQSANEVQAKDVRLLSLEFEDLEVEHLRELWIDRMRYTGDATVTGGMLYEPLRRLRIDDGHFTDEKSKLVAVAPHEVALEHVDARVTLLETKFEALDFAAFAGLTADVKLSASADAHFLNSYLGNVSGLSTLSASGSPGKLEVAVKIADGLLADGALLTYRSPRIAVRLPLVEVSGAAAMTGTTAKGRLALQVNITGAALRQRDGEQLADVDDFSLLTDSPAELTRSYDVDAVIRLKGGHVPRLVLLNQFVPDGAGVRITSGAGLLEGTVHLDSAPSRARGEFALTASGVTTKNRGATATGKLLVKAQVRSFDFTTGAMDLSGSTVALEEATLHAQGRDWNHLWLSAIADPCVLTPNAKVLWSARVSVGASNLQPLLALVSANVPLPGSLALFTDSPNVKVQATLVVRPDRVELPSFSLTSQNVRVEGALTLREASKEDPRLEPWGSAVVHAGALSAGVAFDGPKTSVALGDLVAWAQSRSSNGGEFSELARTRPSAAP